MSGLATRRARAHGMLLVCFASLGLTGCGKLEPAQVVGEWRVDVDEMVRRNSNSVAATGILSTAPDADPEFIKSMLRGLTYSFRNNQRVRIHFKAKYQTMVQRGSRSMTRSGTRSHSTEHDWSISGNSIHISAGSGGSKATRMYFDNGFLIADGANPAEALVLRRVDASDNSAKPEPKPTQPAVASTPKPTPTPTPTPKPTPATSVFPPTTPTPTSTPTPSAASRPTQPPTAAASTASGDDTDQSPFGDAPAASAPEPAAGKVARVVRKFPPARWSPLAMAFSPDGKIALAGSVSGEFLCLDIQAGRYLPDRRFVVTEGDISHINSILFTDDGGAVLTHGTFGASILWNPHTGEQIRRLPLKISGKVAALSGDGRRALFAEHDSAVLFDIENNRMLRRLNGHQWRILAMALPSKDRGFTVAHDGAAAWNLTTGKLLGTMQLAGRGESVRAVAFSGNGDRALVITSRGAYWWDLAKRKRQALAIEPKTVLRDVAISHDGRVAAIKASQNGSMVLFWDLSANREIGRDARSVTSMALSRDGRWALTNSLSEISLWRLPDPSPAE